MLVSEQLRYRERDAQTETNTDGQTARKTDTDTDRQTDWETHRGGRDGQTDTHQATEAYRQFQINVRMVG